MRSRRHHRGASIDTQNTTRDEDLRGPDFFDVARRRRSPIRRSGAGQEIDGTLTIRGISKIVPLAFTFGGTANLKPGKPERVAFHAQGGTKRAEFGMLRELAEEIGASLAMDVTIGIDAEALRVPRR